MKIFAKKCSVLDDFRRSLVGPPFSPTGNKTCAAGFISLAAAFSGRPILTPMLVENLFLIWMPDDFDKICGTDKSEMVGFTLNKRL